MDCKEFTTRHAAFIDDTLPGFQMAAMREHLATCARCARRDAEVRRALFLLKNLPKVQVSDGFQDKLRARITAEGPAYQAKRSAPAISVKWAAAAALLIAVGGVASWPESQTEGITRLPAVYASQPLDAFAYGADDESAPVYVASMSTGIPMWPALMLAEEGPLRFAGMQNASWDASRPHD
jgi:anti-sigma factor RsiW